MNIHIKIYQLLLTLNFLLFFSFPLYPELKNVSLNECIGKAIQNHPEISASEEDGNIARANYKISRAANSPLVNLELRTVQGETDTLSDTDIGIFIGPTVRYNLVDPQRSGYIDSAKLAIDLSKMKSLKVKEDIILNVKKNFYGYLFARENTIKRQQLVDKFQTKLDKAKVLYNLKQRPKLDVTKSELDLADARLEQEKAANYENTIKTELLASMGIMDEDIDFSPIKMEKLPELRFTLKKLYEIAEGNNPDIKIARLNKEINQLNVSVARSAHSPYVDFTGSVGMLNSHIISSWDNPYKNSDEFRDKFQWDNWEKSVVIGLAARVNLWSGGGLDAKVDSKIAEYNKSKYIEREILINIRTQIRNYFQSIGEYKRQLELSQLMIDNSQQHLKLAQKSYENGISTQLELQDAEMAVLNSNLGYIKVWYDYLTILARLSNIVGLGEEYICEK